MAKKFIYETVVKDSQIDVFGHVNNVYYIQYFEEARWSLGDESGFGREYAEKERKGLIVIDFYVRFRKELRAQEKVRVVSEVLQYRKKLVKLEQKIYGESGEVACNGLVTLALFDVKDRKIIPCPDEWHDRIELPRGTRMSRTSILGS